MLSLIMSVDKFGRHESSFVHEVLRGPPGEGFQLTEDGNFDFKRKRVCNLADPINDEEAVNLKTIHTLTLNCDTNDGMFDGKDKRIKNIASAIADTDAVSRQYLLTEINKLKKEFNDKIDKIWTKLFHIIHSNNDENDTENSLPLLTFHGRGR